MSGGAGPAARHRIARAAAGVLAGLLRLWAASWRVAGATPGSPPGVPPGGPAVYAFLHGQQLVLALLHRDQGVVGMVSQSDDGETLAGLLLRLGYGLVRGSSSRGALSALRGARAALADGRRLAVAVDGPRGPRGQAQPGVLALSGGSGAPLIAARCRARPALRLGTWDRFEIPLPFARIELHYTPIAVPPDRGAWADAAGALERALSDPSAR